MRQALWLMVACGLAVGQSSSSVDVEKITHGIEQRYNNIKTLKVNFTETYTDRGGRHVPLRGTLYLEKPRKMRWDYSSPAGQFFVSDGEYDYDYDPKNNQVDRSKVKQSDDLRSPVAFLLGKVDFDRDFGSYVTDPDGSITATPKSDKLLFSSISFVAGPDYRVEKLAIKGQDGSMTSFVFEGEMTNPPLAASLFKFVKPPGAVIQDVKQ